MNSIIIGIDPGVKTGLAIWDVNLQKLTTVMSCKIHEVFQLINNIIIFEIEKVYVIVEDSRQRKWYGTSISNKGKLQGVGSVKRDCSIFEDYLQDLKDDELIEGFKMVHPVKGGTKLNAATFKQITGWKERTNEHGRDAAMLVYKRTLHEFK